MDTEPPKRKRRWYQFSLRTLMIAVTLLAVPCAYVGWQAKVVSERKNAIRRFANGVQSADEMPPDQLRPDRDYSISFVRRWMGDEPFYEILYSPNESVDKIPHLRDLFPEAIVKEAFSRSVLP
jgi:hypothetical protein